MVDQAEIRWKAVSGEVGERREAVKQLRHNFANLPDKEGAWNDLIQLAMGDRSVLALGAWVGSFEDQRVQLDAVDALGDVFQYIHDKKRIWEDLIRVTQSDHVDIDAGGVKWHAVCVLDAVFQQYPDKEHALKDLHRLAYDKDSYVRASANYSLGKAHIFKATETEGEEDFRKEINNALNFFEKSSNETDYFNPSSFCLPFYRSFYTITFEKARAEDEVRKYLAEAKSASEGSQSKEQLLEATENLANALLEAHKVTDFNAMKSDLNTYRQYCDRAADLIGDAAEGAPGAARVLRRGLPMIDDRIKEIIREIQEKAEAVRRETQGTSLEELGLATAISAQELPAQDPLALTMSLGSMAGSARVLCELITTDDEKIHACEQLKDLSGLELSEQSRALAGVLEYITTCLHSHRNEAPPTKTVHISETQKEIVRIAVAQFCFELTESFPFTVENRDEVKTKIFSALEIAKYDGANIICLPELCLCEEWISEIEERYPDMIVIGGSFYKDKMNICPVIMKSDADTHYQPKITPSRNEDPEMTGAGMVSGDAVYIYETRFGRFMVLICRDFDHLLTRLVHRKNPDMIFCPQSRACKQTIP